MIFGICILHIHISPPLQYAGNVLAFPVGDWFGYVTPANVEPLLQNILSEHNNPTNIHATMRNTTKDNTTTNNNNNNNNPPTIPLSDELKPLWRGRMGVPEEQQREVIKQWGLPLPEPSTN